MLLEEDMHRLGSTVLEISHNQDLLKRLLAALQSEQDNWLTDKRAMFKNKADGLIAALEPEFDFVRGMYAVWGKNSSIFENSFVNHIADQKGWVFASAWRSYLQAVAENSDVFISAVRCFQQREVEPVISEEDEDINVILAEFQHQAHTQ